ncbi:hypothetical protein GCM10009647_003570 [Streptomyces sanglieri]|uniref:Uncharacterized protein n=1 Tax=Streptomyces sanglieri TaxID=193460 RepID=A0ABW2WSQ9_9ACTN
MSETGDGHNLVRIDADNTARRKEVVARHGRPVITLVGGQGAEESRLLARHADRDKEPAQGNRQPGPAVGTQKPGSETGRNPARLRIWATRPCW